MAGFELFQHTADVGVRAWAVEQQELLLQAAAGLYSVIGGLQPQADSQTPVPFEFSADCQEVLLRDCMAELLYEYAVHGRLLVGIEVECFTQERLCGRFMLAVIDMQSSEVHQEVKAVTYHELALNQETRDNEPLWTATYIVDL